MPLCADAPESPVMTERAPGMDFSNVPQLPRAVENQLTAMSKFFNRNADWSWDDWTALLELWDRESGWNDQAQNPRSSAAGIPQAMRSVHKSTNTDEWMQSPEKQIDWGLDYIEQRYKTPSAALEKWLWRKENDSRGGWY